MTEYQTKLKTPIMAIDANVDAGKKTQASMEAANFVFGTIPHSDHLTCIDHEKDVAYVVLKRGEGAKQEIQCSCLYFKDNPGMTCEHLLALRAVSEGDYAAAPGWLVTFLENEEKWHVVDGKLVPPSMDDAGEPVPELEKKPEPSKEKKTCPHCDLTMQESRYEKHLSVCKKNPANQKDAPAKLEKPSSKKVKTPKPPVKTTPEAPKGEMQDQPAIIDDVQIVDEEGQEVYEKPVQQEIPQSIAEAMCNMQKTELFAATDSNNPFFNAKYANLASVWAAIRKPLTDNGLSVMQTTEPYEHGITVITTLMHVSGETYSTKLSAKADKQTIQALGSLITYLRRYSLSALVGVASADDDGEAASGRDQKNKR